MKQAPFLDEWHGSKRVSSTTVGPGDPDYYDFLTEITECRRVPVVKSWDLETIMLFPDKADEAGEAGGGGVGWTAELRQIAKRADTLAIIDCVRHVQKRRFNSKPRLQEAITEVLSSK